jgi:hypothetical protein
MTSSAQFYSDPATVPLSHERPLLIVDADEVLLRFADGFNRFLLSRGYYLDFVSYRLHGNVKRSDDGVPALDIEVTGLLDGFREELDTLEAADHAIEVIARLRSHLDAVVLSNVNASQAAPRLRNLAAHGFDIPLLTNSGPKGPAVKRLAQRAGKPVFFVDDISMHHKSVAELAPDVFRIHMVADERLKPLMPSSEHAHIRADDWRVAEAFIREKLALSD